MADDKRNKGLFHKYDVSRTDGSSEPGGKHSECNYFVLDLTHDKFAIPAIMAYANACLGEYPQLAADLFAEIGVANPAACGGPVDVECTLDELLDTLHKWKAVAGGGTCISAVRLCYGATSLWHRTHMDNHASSASSSCREKDAFSEENDRLKSELSTLRPASVPVPPPPKDGRLEA